jgi:hypothetical protein
MATSDIGTRPTIRDIVKYRAIRKGKIPNKSRIHVHSGVDVNTIVANPSAGSPVFAQTGGRLPLSRSSTVADARAISLFAPRAR